ncbi:hypothetical protein PLEOSDRAFT_1103780 [Pleurotus ostreatus PC15]|uniref:Uncharacterized protein n=1 Tax=Pleurotus ostreatus (strain PC15) TaxID=1137138 RepID=A0A067P1N4_PLEO1|nr:hypothetical protein PLEOSDRAFT_1103780 [Pleurotus ostreatus PC15]
MSAFAVSTRTRAPTDINDVDLARPVATLAETISKAMSALYALHVAMGRSCAETSSTFMEFVEYKQRIRTHWAALESLLQHSLGYARDYLALCQSLQHESQAQYAVAGFAILAHAQQIRSEIARFKPAYAGMVKEFEDKEPTAKLGRGNGRHGNGSSFDASVLPFIQTSQAALHPETSDSFKIASSALSDSLIAITDISVFWDRHADYLQKLSRSEESLKRATRDRGHYQAEIARWKEYHTALHDAIYSITSSSDAMRVSPMIQPSNWRRRLGRFMQPKRRATDPATRSGFPIAELGVSGAEYDSLKNPFDVLTLSRTTHTVNVCLESFSQRFRQTTIIHRLGIYSRLYRLAQQYTDTLSSVEALSDAAIEFCAAIQGTMQSRAAAESATFMRGHAEKCSHIISEILPKYQTLLRQLQQELSRTLSRQSADIPSPSSDVWDRDLVAGSVRALKDRELLACIHSTLDRLIHLLTKFRVFWFNAAADSDQLRSFGRVGSLLAQQITPVWQRVEVLLREYRSEAGLGKTLDFAGGPSNDKSPGLFKWKRNTKFSDTDTIADQASVLSLGSEGGDDTLTHTGNLFHKPSGAEVVRRLTKSNNETFVCLKVFCEKYREKKHFGVHHLHRHEKKIYKHVVEQAGVYVGTIDTSLGIAQKGIAISRDVKAILEDPKLELALMVDFMLVKAKEVLDDVTSISGRFREIRVALYDEMQRVAPGLELHQPEQYSYTEEHEFDLQALKRMGDEDLLQLTVAVLDRFAIIVGNFIDWWSDLRTDVEGLTRGIEFIRKKPAISSRVWKQWDDVEKQYRGYNSEIMAQQDYYHETLSDLVVPVSRVHRAVHRVAHGVAQRLGLE